MKAHEILELIANGENSGVEFKLDDIRPERLAKEAVGMVNLQGGLILLGVDDRGRIAGLTRRNLEEWVMDTVFGRYVHPAIIPHYEEAQFPDGKRVAVISLSSGTAKPYVVRHNNREDIFIRIGSTTRPATREQALRLFGAGGLLYTETLPVSGTSLRSLDRVRLENYLRDILGEPSLPENDAAWVERLTGLGFLTNDSLGRTVCTVAGLVLFGIRPRTRLPQSGLRVMVFDTPDKQYQALLDITLDAPMVGRRVVEKGNVGATIDDGLVEKFVQAVEPFLTTESGELDKTFRRERIWRYPMEAVRETALNALAHRDWTRATDIEITRYSDRLEVISPGALPNSMTIDKMKAGRRTPRNPVIMEVLRDYGYVDARGMGVRTKVIPLTRQYTGEDPVFEATDDFVKTVINTRRVPENGPETTLKNDPNSAFKHRRDPKNVFQGQLLALIRANPKITYDQLAAQTGRSRKMVQRHIQSLKASGFLRRVGSAKGGSWEAIES